MNGKLIVIDGGDGSGKSTQLPLLAHALKEKHPDVREISFPCYDLPSGELIQMYLDGKMGTVDEVGAYAASVLYAADRYTSYRLENGWGQAYRNGSLILSARYTTSNMIHQTAKLPESEWAGYIDWLCDFEFKRIGLPSPDVVIYLDMPPAAAQKLLSERYNGDETKKDIHESNKQYILNCRKAAYFAAEHCGWNIIPCADNENPLPVEEINGSIYKTLENAGII